MSRITVACLDMAGTTVADDGTVLEAFAAAVAGLPGAAFEQAMTDVRSSMGQSKIEVFRRILALRHLVTGKYSTVTQVIAVVVFVVIEFLLIIIPFAFLELRPEATKALLKGSQDWLLGHAFQLMAGIALALGAYLTVSGLVRLS